MSSLRNRFGACIAVTARWSHIATVSETLFAAYTEPPDGMGGLLGGQQKKAQD